MKHPEKKFLKRPEYPGGKEAFKQYVKANLIYPEKAREKGIEGIVYLNAQIDDNGTVRDVVVEKGIGGGCDEEAVRLVNNVQFGKVKNRGVRIKTRKKFRIEFKLPARLVYSGKSARKTPSGRPSRQAYAGEPVQQQHMGETTRENPEGGAVPARITYQVSQSKKRTVPAAPEKESKKYSYSIPLNSGD